MRVGRFFGSYRMLPVPHVTWELAKKSAQPADYVWAGKGAAPLRATISDAGPGLVWELYDIAADRTEQHDIAAAHPDVVERMKAELQTWHQSVIASYNGRDYAGN